MKINFTEHAENQLQERNISKNNVINVIQHPEQIIESRYGRKVIQKKVKVKNKLKLFRVVVENYPVEPLVITMYLTSRIDKYWSLQDED